MTVKFTGRTSIGDVMAEMTLEEKCRMVTGGLPYGTRAIPRLGIPHALLNDSAAGVNYRQLFADCHALKKNRLISDMGKSITGMESLRSGERILDQLRAGADIDDLDLLPEEEECRQAIHDYIYERFPNGVKTTAFPAGMMLGATWDRETVRKCAKAVANEFDAFGIDVLLGPNLNIQRDPLGGRNFESFSEDPFLTGELGSSYVIGVQEAGLLATPKHYAVNNQETQRKSLNVTIDERALREIYLPAFEACVKKGKAGLVMSAYNGVNKSRCCENELLLNQILRKEWGFEGVVVSDWGAVADPVVSLKAGNDLEMPMNPDVSALMEAVNSDEHLAHCLDQAVRRVLEMLSDLPCVKGHRRTEIDESFSTNAAYETAVEGSILLKNEGCLPLSLNDNVSFWGEGAKRMMECGAGSNEVITSRTSSTFSQVLGYGGKCTYGVMTEHTSHVIVWVQAKGQEGNDCAQFALEKEQYEFAYRTLQGAKKLGKKTVLVLNVANPVELTTLEGLSDAILCVFVPGSEGGHALADILYGKAEPGGRLPVTFPRRYEDCPSFGNFPGYANEVIYGEGILVGYRYYETKKIQPLYAFGHGLSYTAFRYGQLKLQSGKVCAGGELQAEVEVENIGTREGSTVVQLYVQHKNATLFWPEKELKAFEKVRLKAGEGKVLSFEIEAEQLSGYDTGLGRWTLEPGHFQLLAGSASDHIFSSVSFCVTGKDPYGYSSRTRFAAVWADERCRKLYRKYFGDKRPESHYNDILNYTPDYEIGLVLRERIPDSSYRDIAEKEQMLAQFFGELEEIDLGKCD